MADMRKALLVGSSFSAAPVFFALKKYGLHVSVCGNLTADPCHQYADASFYIDYSKPEELMRVLESEKFDYLVPSCNDYAYMSCAMVAHKYGFFGFDNIDVATILHTKSEFRRITGNGALPVPKYITQRADDPIDIRGLRFPVLVKPVDSFSGRGMTKVANPDQLPMAVEEALATSRSLKVVIEEFVNGTLHSHSAFIEGGKVALDYFVDEFCSVYPYQVDCSNHPSVLSTVARERVRAEINRLAELLGLADGLLHTQFIANGDEFWIIECMRRCPGDLYGTLIQRSTGLDYADMYVRPFLNRKLAETKRSDANRYFGRHTISRSEPLVNFSFSHDIPASSVEIVPLKSSGECLGPAPFDKLAIIFAEYENEATMLDVTPRLAELVDIKQLGGSASD